tara:strand:- start:3131 stop:4228 length:1098 start_codon:yes stop_codon:yes gene_type:complete
MSIPLISGLGFTEVSSAGTLNDKAGTSKSKLPIQFFKLTDNISGNLTLNNDSAHKKIILDTNGKTITNSSGSPLTTNSSTTLELKGSGNIQSTLKTFTSSVASTSNTGTTTISEADSSTVLVGTDHTFTSNLTSFSGQALNNYFGVLNNTTWTGYVGGSLMPNINNANFRMEFNDAFVEDNPAGGGLIVGPGGASSQSNYSSNAGRNCSPVEPASNSVTNGIRTMSWSSAGFDPRSGSNYNISMTISSGKFYMTISSSFAGWNSAYSLLAGGVIPNAITSTGRKFTFTNNLAIPCVVAGSDPFNATVSAGATSVVTRNSTDGSFSLSGSISGSDGDNPYALKPFNDGTGSVNTDAYTGTLSASAL